VCSNDGASSSAGRGIVHSERPTEDLRGLTRRSHGLQLWAALPAAHEEDAPSFEHTPASAIPQLSIDGATVRVLIGSAWGATSPVHTLSETLYVDMALAPGAALRLPACVPERALYGVDAGFELDGVAVPEATMVVLAPGAEPLLSGSGRVVMIGGTPLGHRHMAWNFVSSRRERIAQAAQDWATQPNAAFAQVPGETEFIPLPDQLQSKR